MGPHLQTSAHVIFVVQCASTLGLVGLIWFVQVVHYPLFQRIRPADFVPYEAEHATRTGYVVAPLMLAELLSASLFLLHRFRPLGISTAEARLGAALVSLIWCSTAFLQIPLHNKLHRGFDRVSIQRLITSNWIRTTAWTARAILISSWLFGLLRSK